MPRARALTMQILREILFVVAAYYAYSIAKNLIHPEPATEAFRNAWNIVRFERALGIFHELSLQGWLIKDAMAVSRLL